MIALAVAGTGTVLACLPVVRPLGWILLPIGFVLGLVALFGKNKKIAAALSAIVVTLVGTGVAAVVGLLTVDNTFTTEFRSGFREGFAAGSGMDVASSGTAGPAASAGSGNTEPARGPGSREQPLPLGETIRFDSWDVRVNSVDLDGTDAVLATNRFNDPPDPGTRYAVIDATLTYTGEGSAYTREIGFEFVTDSGNVLRTYDKILLPPDPELRRDELYTGGTSTGNTALQVPAAEEGLLRISGRYGVDQTVFVAVR